MSAFDDFKVGDRVAHISLGDGTVTSVDDWVHVSFDRRTSKGRNMMGVYDRNWFRVCSGYLFFRGTDAPPPVPAGATP